MAGRGGASVVYRAVYLQLGNDVALKVLAPEFSEDDAFRERFVREAQLAASINHPNVITIYNFGAHGEYLFIAMRYVEGSDLRALLARDGALSAERTLALVVQIGRGLEVAHSHGLIHRDVKPANVLIQGAGSDHEHVYISDFGLTKRSGSHTGMTGTGHFRGTIDYMAPEQIEGKDVDLRADVYALACLVYQCLTGSVPYPKDTDTAVLWAQMTDPPPAVTERRPDLSPAVDDVIAKGMAKDRADRYGSCSELVSALTVALGGSNRGEGMVVDAEPKLATNNEQSNGEQSSPPPTSETVEKPLPRDDRAKPEPEVVSTQYVEAGAVTPSAQGGGASGRGPGGDSKGDQWVGWFKTPAGRVSLMATADHHLGGCFLWSYTVRRGLIHLLGSASEQRQHEQHGPCQPLRIRVGSVRWAANELHLYGRRHNQLRDSENTKKPRR